VVSVKAAVRAEAKGRRVGCDPALGKLMAAHVLREFLPPAGAVVGGFWPLEGEIDTRDLLHGLAERGYEVALPETPAPGNVLIFRKWAPGAALVAGRFNTMHPTGAALKPDFVLVPLLAFDNAGNRLGYGAGYYDRTLAALPDAFRLGCAFAAQEMAAIPTGPEDVPLHAVATEAGVRRF
jgi:5-formyltetrahydrofolate cyclo-ligase